MFSYIIFLSVSFFFHVRYGTDPQSMILEDVNCSSSAYLTISQCPFRTVYSSYCQSNSRDVIVTCCELSMSFNCICIQLYVYKYILLYTSTHVLVVR